MGHCLQQTWCKLSVSEHKWPAIRVLISPHTGPTVHMERITGIDDGGWMPLKQVAKGAQQA